MTTNQNQLGDAPGDDKQNEPQTPVSEPKVEVNDGVVTVDGKKYVKESDLMASKESLRGDAEKAQQVHNEAVDKLNLQVSDSNQKLAQANAALEEAKNARESGDISNEELSRIKQENEDAKTKVTESNTTALDYRRKFIMAVYNIPVDSEQGKKLLEKDMTQLDSFEEALKALTGNSRGPGNYLVGGGSGGGATPLSAMDRAKTILENTPYRGVRNTPAQ